MKKILILLVLFLTSCGSNNSNNYNTQSNSSDTNYDYDYGYEWAEDNDIDDFDYCDDEFWSSYWWAEDWCNEYVQENYYNWSTSFWSYECTEDCSWHEAGYEWAENNDIDDEDDCWWNSNSFIEWCIQYVEDNY